MAVHPYTQGFEGCYSEDAPPGSLTPNQCAIADKDHPVFYGPYYMGPRLSRGGLSSGWQTIGKGNILKLSGRRIKQFETAVNLPGLFVVDASIITKAKITLFLQFL